jgi:hypothetical protein
MALEIRCHGRGLITRHRKHVAEPSTRVNHTLACLFRRRNRITRCDLRSSHGGDVRTSSWKGRVEGPCHAGCEVHSPSAVLRFAAQVSVSGDAAVAAGEENGDALQSELHVLVALARGVGGGEVGFVVTVGGADYRGRGECPAGFGG